MENTARNTVMELVAAANRKYADEIGIALRVDNPVALALAILDQIDYPLSTVTKVAQLLEVA